MFDTSKTVPDDNFYLLCRNRDLCLRMIGENPMEYADVTVTPCPCTREYHRKLMSFARVLDIEAHQGPLPYTHKRMTHWIYQEKYPEREQKKPRVVFKSANLQTQQRLL